MYPNFDSRNSDSLPDKSAKEHIVSESTENFSGHIGGELQKDSVLSNEPVGSMPIFSEPIISTPAFNESVVTAPTFDEPIVHTPTFNEPVAPAPTFDEPISHTPAFNEPVVIAPTFDEPIVHTQTFSEPVVPPTPAFDEPIVHTPMFNDPLVPESVFGKQRFDSQHFTHIRQVKSDATYQTQQSEPWSKHSSGSHVNQPYQLVSTNAAPTFAAPKKTRRKAGHVLQAAFLVIICALFSAATAFLVIEIRLNRGDFTVNTPVVLGRPAPETRPGGIVPEPVAVVSEELTASDIYDMALSQVVGISTPSPFNDGGIGIDTQAPPATGSGFIISTNGYILTNYHVIEIAARHNLPVSVLMYDGSTYDAQIVGFDSDNDVALLKINSSDLSPVLIGNSSDIRVGQRVYAIGNPFGDLLHTMTDGIVSALDRVVTVEGRNINFFQTSAAVNRGNSGGPIYNTQGEVIGIVTAKVIRGNAEGIGFAIPINDAIEIAAELIEHGYIAGRPLIGIVGRTVPEHYAYVYERWVAGAYIRGVTPYSAADVAGIRVHDIITALGEVDIDSMAELRDVLSEYRAGDTTTITVWRDGTHHTFEITLDEDMYAGRIRPPIEEPEAPDPFADVYMP